MLDALSIAVQAGVPTLVWGAPGIGKTSMIRQLAESLQWPYEVVIASIREPSDFSGLPVIHDGAVTLVPPAWARRLADAGCGILFLDEINSAPGAVQSALLRVVLERTVGDLQLPPDIRILAAANPVEQAAGGWDLALPLANRFCHLEWDVNSERWIEGMLSGWGTHGSLLVPDQWAMQIPTTRALVASFIRHKPDVLLNVPATEATGSKGWPSPRSWETVSFLLAAVRAAGATDEVEHVLLKGCVGEGAAIAFLTWCNELDLPDPEVILANPKKFKLPKRGDKAFTVLTSVVAAVCGQLTPERWTAGWDVLAAAAQQNAVDIASLAAKQLALKARSEFLLPNEQIKPFLPILELAGMLRAAA